MSTKKSIHLSRIHLFEGNVKPSIHTGVTLHVQSLTVNVLFDIFKYTYNPRNGHT